MSPGRKVPGSYTVICSPASAHPLWKMTYPALPASLMTLWRMCGCWLNSLAWLGQADQTLGEAAHLGRIGPSPSPHMLERISEVQGGTRPLLLPHFTHSAINRFTPVIIPLGPGFEGPKVMTSGHFIITHHTSSQADDLGSCVLGSTHADDTVITGGRQVFIPSACVRPQDTG